MSIANASNPHQVAHDRLLRERVSIIARMKSMAQDALSFELETDGVPPSGQEGAEAVSLVLSERLSEVDRALARLDEGRYGICAGCLTAIPARRLEVQPSAVFCVHCQSEAERRRTH